MTDFIQYLPAYLPGIGLSYAAFLIAIASPGPNVLALISTSMSVGRKAGMALALGISFGSFTWALLTAFGLSALLMTCAHALTTIKIIGGIYLFWLAYNAFKSAAPRSDLTLKALVGGRRTPLGYAVRGYTVHMTNPKAVLAWVAIIALGLPPEAPLWVGLAIVFGCFGLSIAVHLTYALVFSTPSMSSLYLGARRGIQATLGVSFTFAGLKLLLSRP